MYNEFLLCDIFLPYANTAIVKPVLRDYVLAPSDHLSWKSTNF